LPRGVYIAVEGVDGAGKTTQARKLVKYLRKHGYNAVYTYEPSKGPVGQVIRRMLKNMLHTSEDVMALLFAADRLHHHQQVVANLLRQGFVVVSDRSVVSSLAYQTAATKRRDWVREVNRYALKPDIVVYIDLSPETALKRLGRKRYRYEEASFLQKVSKEYDRILKAGWRVVRVDGDQPVDDVFKDIAAGVERYLRKLSG